MLRYLERELRSPQCISSLHEHFGCPRHSACVAFCISLCTATAWHQPQHHPEGQAKLARGLYQEIIGYQTSKLTRQAATARSAAAKQARLCPSSI